MSQTSAVSEMASDEGDLLPAQRVHLTLRRRLTEGGYRPGERLPTEREFGKEFGVSRLTVAKAMAQLVAEGLVSRTRGRGSFVTVRRSTAGAESPAGARLVTYISPGGPQLNVRRGILQGLHQVLDQAGYSVAVDFYGDRAQYLRCLAKHGDPGSAAFALWPIADTEARPPVQALVGGGFPTVLVDTHLGDLACDYVVTDNAAGATAMVEHLVSLGHRRIVYLTDAPGRTSLSDRLGGYLRGVFAAGMEVGPQSVVRLDSGGADELGRVVERLLARPERPTALFCANDELAMALFWLLRDRGVRVPEDISLAGYDDIDAAADFAVPLTTVRQNYFEMGRIAGSILLDRLGRQGVRIHYEKRIQPRLRIRRSTAPVPQ